MKNNKLFINFIRKCKSPRKKKVLIKNDARGFVINFKMHYEVTSNNTV